jgi:hypothetical protein
MRNPLRRHSGRGDFLFVTFSAYRRRVPPNHPEEEQCMSAFANAIVHLAQAKQKRTLPLYGTWNPRFLEVRK